MKFIMRGLKSKLLGVGLGAAMLVSTSAVQAVAVDVELLLLADVSGSLDAADFALQRDGYVAAFQSVAVQNAIASLPGGIAVALGYWSDIQTLSVGWTQITNAAEANAFAALIAAAARPSSGGTGMTAAINWGVGLFTNGFEGAREVIDISGDGAESNACLFYELDCVPLQGARDAALARIDTINALWIEDEAQPSDRRFFCLDALCDINPLTYGSTNVIGGTGAFQNVVSNFDGFRRAVEHKIERDLVPVPEPATLGLLGLALAALGFSRRKQA